MSAPTGTELLLPVAVSVGHGALGFPGQLLPGALSFPTPVTPVYKGHRVAWHMVALEDRHHSSVSGAGTVRASAVGAMPVGKPWSPVS